MSYHGTGTVAATLCLTEDQKAAAIAACKKKTQVRGLGQTTDPCALAQLPVCGPGETPFDAGEPGEPAADGGKKTLMFGGILLLVLAGGYALYRSQK